MVRHTECIVLIDNEHVRGISIVAWLLENCVPKRDWKPRADTIADIRRSFLQRSYEERQRKPDDLEQLPRVKQGFNPMYVMRDPRANRQIPASVWKAPGTRSCRRQKPPCCRTAGTSTSGAPAGALLAGATPPTKKRGGHGPPQDHDRRACHLSRARPTNDPGEASS
jgi:hypothetical protein